VAIPINSLLPHRLARLCKSAGARLIQISTDCVFLGARGMYREADIADAQDLYGRSKLLGEVDEPHAMTLRTSLIGRELASARSLVGWFLAQEGSVKGYERAIFSGMPTVELARVMRDFIIPHPDLHGVYHIAARPISKYELLKLVAAVYGKQIRIIPDRDLVIDRSLSGERFHGATGYVAPDWPELITRMHDFQ
jgi:dTDP-4-dehydrorhamnose reductase